MTYFLCADTALYPFMSALHTQILLKHNKHSVTHTYANT